MVSKESGPGWVFKHLRRLVKREAPKKSRMDEGIECLFCMSMQFGLLLSGARWAFAGHPVYDFLILALAFSAVAVVLNQAFTRGKL